MNIFCVYPDFELQQKLFGNAMTSIYEPGTHLFQEGQVCQKLFFLKKGRVRIYIRSESGNEVLEQFSQEGCILGLPTAIRNEIYLLNVEVIERAEVMTIPGAELAKQMKKDAGICLKIAELLSKEVESLKTSIQKLGQPPTLH